MPAVGPSGEERGGDREGEALLKLDFARVLHEEGEHLQRRKEFGKGLPFSVAFSGGGIRAAAFQAGVLWRLAEEGRLRDVEYLAAVSGGAYIASSFVSHLITAEQPPTGTSLDAWYRRVVSKALCRMQRNAGDFVRDPSGAAFTFPTDGSSLLPRICDVPLLVATLFITLSINPFLYLIVYLVPATEIFHLFFGAALRAYFCAPTTADSWHVLRYWSPFGMLIGVLEALSVATVVVWLASKAPLFQLDSSSDGSKGRTRSLGFMMVHGMLAFLRRFVALLFLLLLMVSIVPRVQIWEFNAQAGEGHTNVTRAGFCSAYVSARVDGIGADRLDRGCSNFHDGRPWYEDSLFETPPEQGRIVGRGAGSISAEKYKKDDTATTQLRDRIMRNRRSAVSLTLGIFMLVLLAVILLVPFQPGLFLTVLVFAGPVMCFVAVLLLAQYRIYGPLTGQSFMFEFFPFNRVHWDRFAGSCFVASLIMLPFYNDLQRIWHWYYLRCLQTNFFENGKDVPFQRLRAHPSCPFVLLTGTVNDYQKPGHTMSISEISFSPLHTGSEVTGYVRTPSYRTLGKCTALSGAGCLDAITLSMTNQTRFRFWLEMLNLSWGDYIIFDNSASSFARRFIESMSEEGSQLERSAVWLFHRLPCMLLALVNVGLVIAAWYLAKSSRNQECYGAKGLALAAVIWACCVAALSFFAFLPQLNFLMFSPFIRQFHQATGFKFMGDQPPRLLYVTDGGVQDCTALVQLMRRRCERILLVLAASDPGDELSVLRSAMDLAVKEQLGSFYDIEDPRRDVRILLDEYGKDKAKPYLHMGIRYGWSTAPEPEGLGELIVVKNRLPPEFVDQPVPPLLTEAEISGEEQADAATGETRGTRGGAAGALLERTDEELKTSDLGGFCCCDCCHRRGCNCGRKFPHLTGANYLWLTPQLFSSLCRLGHDVSGEAVAKLSARRDSQA